MKERTQRGCRVFLGCLVALAALPLTTPPTWSVGLTNISARAYVGVEDEVSSGLHLPVLELVEELLEARFEAKAG